MVLHTETVGISEVRLGLLSLAWTGSHVEPSSLEQGLLVTFHLLAESDDVLLGLLLVFVKLLLLETEAFESGDHAFAKSLFNEMLSLKTGLLLWHQNITVELVALPFNQGSDGVSHLLNEELVKLTVEVVPFTLGQTADRGLVSLQIFSLEVLLDDSDTIDFFIFSLRMWYLP